MLDSRLNRSSLIRRVGAVVTINMACPRASVYDPGGGSWYLQWFSMLLLGAVFLGGVVAYVYLKRARRIVPLVG